MGFFLLLLMFLNIEMLIIAICVRMFMESCTGIGPLLMKEIHKYIHKLQSSKMTFKLQHLLLI